MSSATLQSGDTKNGASGRAAAERRPTHTWWIMFQKEVQELWVSGKALTLLLVFAVILGVETWVFASNSELSLMPPKELVFETLSAALSISVLISLIIGTDSISGERERSTLEALLLTPMSRRQIVLGKFLGVMTIWPATLLVATPFMYVLAQNDEAFVTGMVLGLTLGTILAIGLTALGMFVSFWCNSNKTSYFISLGIYLVFLIPAQLPGRAQKGFAGKLLQRADPMASVLEVTEKILVNNRTVGEFKINLYSPIIFAVLMLALLFLYAAPRLSLEANGVKWPWRRSRAAAAVTAAVIVFSLFALPLTARAQVATPSTDSAPLDISITRDYEVLKSGDSINFDTTVTNNGNEPSPPVIVAMNIINLDKEGDVVDPEDWSPQRTQYIDELGPRESGTLSWRVNAILDGDYLVYMVAMPEPAGEESTSQAVASQGIHLTVAPFHSLNPSGVLPFSIGVPAVIGILLFYVYWRRRRGAQADVAAAAGAA